MMRIWASWRPNTFSIGVGDLPDGRLGPGGVHRQVQQVALAGVGAAGQRVERGPHGGGVALGPQPVELGQLARPDRRVVDLEDVDRRLVVEAVLVDARPRSGAGVDAGLGAGRGLLDAQLGHPGLDGLGHAAHALDLADVRPRPWASSAVSRST